jgi:hypothetical protein
MLPHHQKHLVPGEGGDNYWSLISIMIFHDISSLAQDKYKPIRNVTKKSGNLKKKSNKKIRS